MIVTGFPTDDNPAHGVFNKRAAEQLAEYVDLTVFHLRMWRPGRRLARAVEGQKFKHLIISAPYMPIFEKAFLCSSISMYDITGSRYYRNELKNIDMFHSVGASAAGILGSRWAKKYNKHNVLQVIGTDVNTELPQMLNLKCFRGFNEWTQGVGCNSAALKQAYERLMGKQKNIEVIYRGIDVNRFKPSQRQSKNAVTFLFLGGVPFYKSVMHTRNLKGGVTLIDTWLANEEFFGQHNARLIFAGPDSDSAYVNDRKKTLKYPRAFINPGILKPEEVRKYMMEADVVLIPSLEEGMPNVLMEAAASGKCVIATNIGGIPELIKDNKTGLLVREGDINTLGEAMKKVVDSPGIIQELGRNARDTVVNDFDSSNFAKRYFELYKKVLGEHLA
jgi:glycosyltransferase involved in cell wall biosynthesis